MSDLVVYWGTPSLQFETQQVEYAIFDLQEKVKNMSKYPTDSTGMLRCPLATSHLKNTFRFLAPINYNITWDGVNFASDMYDQKFFNRHVFVRDTNIGLASIRFGSLLMYSEESVKVELKNAIYSQSDFSKSTSIMEGTLDIGRWFRDFDITTFFNFKDKNVTINRGDSLFYFKFHTDSKIKFKKYYVTPELLELREEIMETKQFSSWMKIPVRKKMDYFYNLFDNSKYKNKILSVIKNNLME